MSRINVNRNKMKNKEFYKTEKLEQTKVSTEVNKIFQDYEMHSNLTFVTKKSDLTSFDFIDYSDSNLNSQQNFTVDNNSNHLSTSMFSEHSYNNYPGQKIHFPISTNYLNLHSKQENLNEHLTIKLQKLLEYHIIEDNKHKIVVYRNAISQIQNFPERINNWNQIKYLKYIGKHIGRKIKEILITGNLKKTDYLCRDHRNKTIKLFKSVFGIGVKLANILYSKGMRTISDLRKNKHLLNQTQIIGLKFFEDLIKKIPRKECQEILEIIKKELYKILPDDIVKIELCGSYRRGKQNCGDIDVLITRTDDSGIDGILTTLIENLVKIGIIKEIVCNNSNGNRFFHATTICKLDNYPHRQLDIKIYFKEYYAFALLYFTGSAHFNRNLRLHANEKGFKLTDISLEYIEEDLGKKISLGKYVKCDNEEEIFKSLGLEYQNPSDRDI